MGEVQQDMKKHMRFLSTDGATKIHAILWTSETVKPKGIVQLIHGMVEFIDRYDDFAKFLTEQGYIVVGHDHLGHGESVTDPERLGYFAEGDPARVLLQDIHRLRIYVKNQFPNLPYFMLGHSMGSYLLRRYLSTQGEGLSGAIIMGTGQETDAAVTAGLVMIRSLAKLHGWEYRDEKLKSLLYNANYKKYDTTGADLENSWLTKRTDIVKAYYENPLNSFCFTLNGYEALLSTVLFCGQKRNIQAIPKDLPLFLVSGEDDPVGALGKAVKKVYEMYVKAGISDVECKLYPNDRHEILNETDNAVVYADIANWINSHLPEAEPTDPSLEIGETEVLTTAEETEVLQSE